MANVPHKPVCQVYRPWQMMAKDFCMPAIPGSAIIMLPGKAVLNFMLTLCSPDVAFDPEAKAPVVN